MMTKRKLERIVNRIRAPGDAHQIRRNNWEKPYELKTDNLNIVQYLTKKAGEIHAYTMRLSKKKNQTVFFTALVMVAINQLSNS